MKTPCTHIFSVTETYEVEMLGSRWLNSYQYAFDRNGYEEISNFFRKMERHEHVRWKELKNTIPVCSENINRSMS